MTSAQRIQELSTRQTASKQDMTMESQTCKQMVPVLLSGMVSEKYDAEIKKLMLQLRYVQETTKA